MLIHHSVIAHALLGLAHPMNSKAFLLALETLSWLIVVATVPGAIELLLVTIGGVLPPRRRLLKTERKERRTAIVIPSHNEEQGIASCVRSLLSCEPGRGELAVVVVADNCSDKTAEEAERAGARVLVRHDLSRRGKGYALDHAFTRLQAEGYELFIIVDADSTVTSNLVNEFQESFAAGAGALQCRYKVRNAADSIRTRIMNSALMGFNILRPRGRDRLGVSAGILGNGFGVSSETLEAVPYHANSLVEDLEYHLRLVRAGLEVRFVDAVTVFGEIPSAGPGVATQRKRWEGGRLRMVYLSVPGLLKEILRGNLRQIEPTLELLLLPLGFHVGVLAFLLIMTPILAARAYAGAALLLVAFHVVAAVFVGGGGWADILALLSVPLYVLWKIWMIPGLWRSARQGTEWVRTERETPKGEHA
jgi:cellulose synthase/poly-beta-1,6-N-acetylglucosamine synthase-like glycosyltransferase